MRRWQFDVLFGIAAGGAVFLIFAQRLGIELSPTALTGYGAILTYVLTQRNRWVETDDERDTKGKNGQNSSTRDEAGDGK